VLPTTVGSLGPVHLERSRRHMVFRYYQSSLDNLIEALKGMGTEDDVSRLEEYKIRCLSSSSGAHCVLLLRSRDSPGESCHI